MQFVLVSRGRCSECDTPGPSAPKRRRTEDLNKEASTREGQFKAPQSPTKMAKICQGCVPQNTAKCTSWTLRVFQSWCDQRNNSVEEQCPDDLLESPIVDRERECS